MLAGSPPNSSSRDNSLPTNPVEIKCYMIFMGLSIGLTYTCYKFDISTLLSTAHNPLTMGILLIHSSQAIQSDLDWLLRYLPVPVDKYHLQPVPHKIY